MMGNYVYGDVYGATPVILFPPPLSLMFTPLSNTKPATILPVYALAFTVNRHRVVARSYVCSCGQELLMSHAS